MSLALEVLEIDDKMLAMQLNQHVLASCPSLMHAKLFLRQDHAKETLDLNDRQHFRSNAMGSIVFCFCIKHKSGCITIILRLFFIFLVANSDPLRRSWCAVNSTIILVDGVIFDSTIAFITKCSTC